MQTMRHAVRAFVGLPSPSDTDYLPNSLADLTKAITELRETQIEQTKLINALTRTAAGRGTVWIGDNRIVTRMSLPDMFYDDPLFILNADDVQLLPPLIRDGYYELNTLCLPPRARRTTVHRCWREYWLLHRRHGSAGARCRNYRT